MSKKLEDVGICVFDAYGTLFDVAAAAAACKDEIGDKWADLADLWRTKQLNYTWLRSLMDEYVGFWQVTEDALDYALATLEMKDDALKKKLRLQMPKGLFMPVERRDLLELLLVQDKAANQAKDISGIIVGRKMNFPGAMAELLPAYVTRCEDACRQAKTVIDELDELVETGFAGKEIEIVASIINELDAIEKDTDKIQIKIRAALMKVEQNLPPVDVIFFYKVIEGIGEVADISQRIGSRVELLLAK